MLVTGALTMFCTALAFVAFSLIFFCIVSLNLGNRYLRLFTLHFFVIMWHTTVESTSMLWNLVKKCRYTYACLLWDGTKEFRSDCYFCGFFGAMSKSITLLLTLDVLEGTVVFVRVCVSFSTILVIKEYYT